MKFYEGCTALITGASAGLGAEFARQLAPYAKGLVLVARRTDRLEAMRDELQALHSSLKVHIYGADLSDENQRLSLANWLHEQKIRVDFLVNNAGFGDRGPFETGDWDKVRGMIDVNVTALTHLTHLLLPAMTRSGRAAILNVSSVASFFPLPNMAVYSATKAYVTSLSEALGIELRPRGITVTALCPGPVETDFFTVARRSDEENPAAHYESMPAFVVTAPRVVQAGLEAVIAQRARVIPGPVLAVAVTLAMLVPFFLTREILRAFRSKL
ncbi:SDR family oxidoreductase [soil metagenome]